MADAGYESDDDIGQDQIETEPTGLLRRHLCNSSSEIHRLGKTAPMPIFVGHPVDAFSQQPKLDQTPLQTVTQATIDNGDFASIGIDEMKPYVEKRPRDNHNIEAIQEAKVKDM